MPLTVKAYAKLNLFLDILGKLDNGFHDVFMLMQSIDLYDTVTVQLTDSGKISIECDKPDIPTGNSNIAYKAAISFFEYMNINNSGLDIQIKKRIPHAAGLAGGSADAAAVIRALEKLYSLNLSDREIIEICQKVGSDVPFCALGGTMLAIHTGTVLAYLPQLSIPNIVLVKPDCSISTSVAYNSFDSCECIRHLNRSGVLSAAKSKDLDALMDNVGNVFEQFIDVPDRIIIKSIMRKHNAKCSCMSGSGPSVFGIFNNKKDAANCADELKERYKETFLCSSIGFGVQ